MFTLVLEELKRVFVAVFVYSTRHNIAADMKMLLEIDPNLKVAREGAPRLEKLHKEKMEKMKDEAIGEHSAYDHGIDGIWWTKNTRLGAVWFHSSGNTKKLVAYDLSDVGGSVFPNTKIHALDSS